ncbi:Rossmann-like and DUF2520 domain-containing protein [Planosporangium mesophilum]|uniref:DUF2520 domain-containing protein n=1 Tax=Planosporangium mesophilum TaxID=689768 RepID=A0A8J3TJE2_9ACTN|nr:Rossmann-like and DUF2520 domain-containing protein [Planosporangium mesophilum]NJC82017.1 DUF2520 domain-containing protein [Planosporangium mesophilum]GII26262.1 hypothetical protein Pme01_58590 [Planosporangium mesophilum]
MTASPLTVGVVGAGRVGAVLGAAFAAAGHEVVAASGVSAASRDRIAHLLPTAAVLPADEVAARARLVIVSVPDDVLAALVAGLAETGALGAGQVVAHTSGAHGLGVLAPAVVAGAAPLALHPAMTFTGTRLDLDRLREGVSFGVTAPADLRPLATRIVADLGGIVEWISDERRALYHAGLAHGANHLVTLVNEAMDRLRDAGVADPARVLDPLLHAALDNTLRLGDSALTGPVSRGDAGTVARHLATLGETAPESVPAYLVLARRTADRAIAAGRLRARDAEPLLDVLVGNREEAAA